MTDLELLELAAKAAGVKYDPEKSNPRPVSGTWWGLWLTYGREPHEFDRRYWNPLTDDGDALRLAVNQMLKVSVYGEEVFAVSFCGKFQIVESIGDSPFAATRRAIVRAAAELATKEA
jgi:hypothetical protein